MSEVTRREILGMAAAVGSLAALDSASAAPAASAALAKLAVDLSGDGIPLTPAEYAELLQKLTAHGAVAADHYSLGGAIEVLEKQFAGLLGKEMAVFMPSGTLANQLAVRALCAGNRRRALVQEVSHLYNDSGDCAQQLSQLTLVPLAPGKATFSWPEVDAAIDRSVSGRVPMSVGVISIESPVRRLHHAMFDFDSMQRIAKEARARGIGLHLDGARLFVACAYSGRKPTDYASLFDTVYVSLWKCFNAASGAVLAGPKSLLGEMFHTRRMFGGNLWGAWPFAAVASHYAEGYLDRLTAAVGVAEDVWKRLGGDTRFSIERVPNGTSGLRITPRVADLEAYRLRLRTRGVMLPPAEDGGFWLRVNETMRGASADAIAEAFRSALS